MSIVRINKKNWDSQRRYRKIKQTVEDPVMLDMVAARELEILEFVRGNADDLSVFSLSTRSFWYAAEGVVRLMGGDLPAVDLMYHSVYYGEAFLRLLVTRYLVQTGRPLPLLRVNEAAKHLATALALGCWKEAAGIAESIRMGLAARRRDRASHCYVCAFYGEQDTALAPFILQLYSEFSGVRFPTEEIEFAPMEAFGPFLNLWRTDDLASLRVALVDACNFHIARVLASKQSKPYEFYDYVSWLYPMEILAVLRLREKLGLANPEIDHPLLNTPAGRLYDIKDVPRDGVIDKALERSLAYFKATYGSAKLAD